MFLYSLVIIFISMVAVAALYFAFKNKSEKSKLLFLKILALSFFVVYSCRLILTFDVFERVVNLKSTSFSKNSAGFTAVLRWLTYAAALIISISPFSKLRNQRNLVLFFALPVVLLNVILFKTNITAALGSGFNPFNFRAFELAFELTLALVICGFLSVSLRHKTDVLKEPKKVIQQLLVTGAAILLCAMPIWLPQQLFGRTNIEVEMFSIGHHIWIAAIFLIYALMYYMLRGKNEEQKYYALMFLSVATFLNFFGNFHIDSFKIGDLPFHICNLATALIPFALAIKNKFLFSFTYYINVVGALVAIIVPDLSTPLLSSSSIKFIHEHTMAFILPILFVKLGLFPRTNKRDLKRALLSFSTYFVLVIFLNAWINNYDPSVQYFYLNGNFLSNKFLILRQAKEFDIVLRSGSLNFNFYPLFYLIIYVFFTLLLVGFFFLYRQIYQAEDEGEKIYAAKVQRQLDHTNLLKELNGRAETEPLNKIGGIMLKLTNFSKQYGNNKPVIEEFNLEVREGEVFGFLGSNGAGKSTTIKSLVGILPFEKGKIEINGFDIVRQPLEAKRQIGYVPDNHAVYEKLTGRQYVNFIADLYGVDHKSRDERVTDLLKKFRLEASFDSLIKTYSHGMKQKITIIGALVHSPNLWVLDEPLTGLDPQSAFEVKEYMREHAKQNKTVFFSSHIIEVVEKICDRVAIISRGRLEGVYDMKELAKKGESLEKIFLSVTSAGSEPEAEKPIKSEKKAKTKIKAEKPAQIKPDKPAKVKPDKAKSKAKEK